MHVNRLLPHQKPIKYLACPPAPSTSAREKAGSFDGKADGEVAVEPPAATDESIVADESFDNDSSMEEAPLARSAPKKQQTLTKSTASDSSYLPGAESENPPAIKSIQSNPPAIESKTQIFSMLNKKWQKLIQENLDNYYKSGKHEHKKNAILKILDYLGGTVPTSSKGRSKLLHMNNREE